MILTLRVYALHPHRTFVAPPNESINGIWARVFFLRSEARLEVTTVQREHNLIIVRESYTVKPL